MATYKELRAEVERLQQQAEIALEAEKTAKIEEIRRLIVEYRLYPRDLGFRVPSNKAESREPKVARYRDPETGKTWSGFGRAPSWLASKDREAFAI